MKKILLFFACLASFLIGQAATYSWSNSYTSAPFSPASGKTEQTFKTTLNNVEWSFTFQNTGTGTYYVTATAANGIQFGSNNQWSKDLLIKTSDISGTIKSVKVNAKYNKNVANLSVKVGGTAFQCNNKESAATTTSLADYTFTGSGSGEIEIKFSRTSQGANYLKSIEIEYEEATTSTKAANPTFSEPEGTVQAGTSVTVSCATTGAKMFVYADNDNDIDAYDENPYTFTVNKTVTVTAQAYTDVNDARTYSDEVSVTYTVNQVTPPPL